MNREKITYKNIKKIIDHSLLNPVLNEKQHEDGIKTAIAYNVTNVCIMPYYLNRCSQILKGTDVKSSTTIGFPHWGIKWK